MKALINTKSTKMKFPPIGLRLVKSAIAVFICFIIHRIRGEQGFLFYSVSTAIFCMQPYINNSKTSAKQRIFGTVNGGFWGCIILLINTYVITDAPMIWKYFIISVASIFVIYTSVLLKKPSDSYFSCTVFLSATVVHITDPNPYVFVLNRMLDTLIGIVVSLVINQITFPRKYKNDILFVSGLDETLLNDNEQLSPYSIVEINRMLERGALFTIATERTTTSLIDTIKNINLKLPIIAFNGAILFDIHKKQYIRKEIITPDVVNHIQEVFKDEKVCLFATVLLQDTLLIYYDNFYNTVEEQIYAKLRTSLYRNYIHGNVSKDLECFYIMCIDTADNIARIYQRLKKSPIYDNIRLVRVLSKDFEGYTYLKIYHKNATKQNMLNELKKMLAVEKSISFGTIPGQYDVLIDENDNYNSVVKHMKKLYEPSKWSKK
jgi:hydroxymethylpyrimidine pyrophosphatase-like HAD family hydrolase